jgi:hypothetical protein
MNWTTFMPKHAFDTTREVMFEGHPMRVPGDWYETLTCNYGDDFGIIPTAQKLHLEMSHTGLPAQPYIDDFLQAITKDQIANHLKEYKEASLEYGYQKTKVVVDFHHARGVLIKRQLQQRIDASGESLTALMDENTLESAAKIAEILGDYVDLQVNARLLKWHAHFGASDEIDEAVAYTLMIQGKSRKVDQFLGMRIHNGIGITERMKQIRFAAHQVRCLKKHWHYGEYEKGREYLAWAKENLPALEEIRAFELLYEYVEATDEATKRAVLAHAEALLTEFPENHRMRKVQADCQFDLGDTEAARAGYTWLIENTRNGFILNDIRKKPLDLPEFKA